jgi:aspartyl-tRNA(Asn)/glutamyl-tRNA(Gln) amidotransferase subunit C
MALSPEQVRQVAALAALELQPDEVAQLATQLGAILEYVQELNELDTSNVEPTTHVAVAALPFRPDQRQPCLTQAEATAGAPRAAGGAFAVPTFVEEA